MRSFAVLVLVAASLPAMASPQADRVALQLKWRHQFQFAGYYAAQAKGFYAQEGLDVTIMEGDIEHPPIARVLSGKAEFGVSDADLLLDRLQGKPLVALAAIFQHSPYILMSRADSGIRVPSDLRGKTIMVSDGQGIVQFKAILRREGISLDSVRIVPHTWDNNDLIQRRVDAVAAYSTVEPYQMRAAGVEPHMIRASDYGIDFYGDTLFTTEDQVKRHPERVAAFRRASQRGWEYAMDHPEEMIELILKMPGVAERGITHDLLSFEASAMRELLLPGVVAVGHMNPGRWEAMARLYADAGLISGMPRSLGAFVYDPHATPSARWLLPVAIGCGILAFGGLWVFLWNLQLRRVVGRRTAELRAAKHVAEEANQAKDHFLAVLSHELRTPLTPVLTTAAMLSRDESLPRRCREDAETIRRNVELEARLIDDLLDITRIVRGKLEVHLQPTALWDIVRRAVAICRADIEEHRLRLALDAGDAGECVVPADAARLQQVFWNLLKNSVRHTPPGGSLKVTARQEDGAAVVEVADTGEGIEPGFLPRIFNAFEQGETGITRKSGGLGLGLTISKSLIEMHGGGIEARSDGRGKGSTFIVRLPMLSPERKVLSPEARPALSTQDSADAEDSTLPRPLRILLVEDHVDTARIMRRLLMSEGHEVKTAGDVTTAQELAGRETFDLLISDLGLPDGSGHDLMHKLRSNGHTLPGIALSGYGMEEDLERSREAGFARHLTKPAMPEQLAAAIAEVTAAAPAAALH